MYSCALWLRSYKSTYLWRKNQYCKHQAKLEIPTSNINYEKQSVPNQIQFVESQDNLGFSPQILVKNPNSNIFAQTIPSPIQFAQTVAKQPYVAGQNKQQYLRGRQSKPFPAHQQDNETPTYILLNPRKQTKPASNINNEKQHHT